MLKAGILLALVFAAFAMSLRAGFIGLLTWEWLSVMQPQSEVWAGGLVKYLNFVAGLLTVFAVFTAKDRRMPPANGFTIMFVIFTIFVILSQIFSMDRSLSARHFGIATEVLFISFAAMLLVNSKLKIQVFVWVFVLSLGYYGVTRGLMTLLGGGSNSIIGPARSILTDNNQFALALASMAPLAYYLFRTSKEYLTRMGALGIFVLSIVTVFGTSSRGGLIALSVMTLGLLTRAKRKFLNLFIIALVCGGTLLMLPDRWFNRMGTIDNAESDTSFMGRVEAWEVAFELGAAHPLLGMGPRIHYFPQYNRSVAPIQTVGGEAYGLRATHNAFLEIFAGHGAIALLMYVGMIMTTFFWCGNVRKMTKKTPGLQWANELASMLQISIAAFTVGSMALSVEYWLGLWFTMVLAVNLRELVMREKRAMTQRNFQPAPVPLMEEART